MDDRDKLSRMLGRSVDALDSFLLHTLRLVASRQLPAPPHLAEWTVVHIVTLRFRLEEIGRPAQWGEDTVSMLRSCEIGHVVMGPGLAAVALANIKFMLDEWLIHGAVKNADG